MKKYTVWGHDLDDYAIYPDEGESWVVVYLADDVDARIAELEKALETLKSCINIDGTRVLAQPAYMLGNHQQRTNGEKRMNFYAIIWLILGILYGACFAHAPIWIQAAVGMALGLLAGVWPKSRTE